MMRSIRPVRNYNVIPPIRGKRVKRTGWRIVETNLRMFREHKLGKQVGLKNKV